MKYTKKGRTKQRNEENGGLNGKLDIAHGENGKDGRRKSGEKYKLDQQGDEKKAKKELNSKNQDQILRRSDSPGIDLSIFEPRGKRRCVIQNELKKQRDWWDEDEEEEEEESDTAEEGGEGGKKRDHQGEDEKDEMEEEIRDIDADVDDEIEEEIIDDDDDDDDNSVFKEDSRRAEVVDTVKNEEKPAAKPKRSRQPTKASNGVSKNKEHIIIPASNIVKDDTGNATAVPTSRRYFVFSTALANRAGHAVSRGLHDSISKYHASQQWQTPYLSAEVHCRPFIAELEDKLIADQLKGTELLKKQLQQKPIKNEEVGKKVPQNTTAKLQKAASVDLHQAAVKVEQLAATDNKDRTLSVDSWQKEQVIQAAQRMANLTDQQQQQQPKVKTEELSPKQQQQQCHNQQQQQQQQQLLQKQQQQQQSPPEENNKNTSPLHPRFHLFNSNPNTTTAIIAKSSNSNINSSSNYNKTTTTTTTTMNTMRNIDDSCPTTVVPPKTKKRELDVKKPPNGVLVTNAELLKTNKNKNNNPSPRHHLKNENINVNNIPPSQLVSSALPPKESHMDNRQRVGEQPPSAVSLKTSTQYPADITNVKHQLRYQSPKDFSLDKLISASKEVDINVRPTVINMPSDRTATENVRSSIDIAEKQLNEARFRHSPPILPRDIRSSAFVPTRESLHLRTPSFKGGFAGIPPSVSTDNPLYLSRLHQLHNLHPSSFSPVTSHHYQHSREAIENIIDFSSRNPALSKTPVRPTVSRTNGYSDSKAFNENYKPLISSFTTAHRKDRPSSLPVPELYSRSRSEEKLPKHNPFSVETLTQSHSAGNNRSDPRISGGGDENSHHLERRFTAPPHHHRPFHERVLPSAAHDIHAVAVAAREHERLHMPNGISIHNGLKRTLDEQLSNNISRVENERKYFEHWRGHEKDRILTPPDDSRLLDKDRILLEKDRLLHGGQVRPPFRPDPRSPLHIPAAYLARVSLPNGNGSHHSNEPISPHVLYSHVRRVTPYTANKFQHS